jgi:hypothetical protein
MINNLCSSKIKRIYIGYSVRYKIIFFIYSVRLISTRQVLIKE